MSILQRTQALPHWRQVPHFERSIDLNNPRVKTASTGKLSLPDGDSTLVGLATGYPGAPVVILTCGKFWCSESSQGRREVMENSSGQPFLSMPMYEVWSPQLSLQEGGATATVSLTSTMAET